MSHHKILCLIALILTTWTVQSVCSGRDDHRLSVFQSDVTAPIGHALMGGGIAPASEVIDPLYCKGVVLLGPEKPVVIASIDWCELRNAAYDQWRQALAEAAGTDRERVFFSCIHQHDTPIADLEAQRLLDEVGLEKSLCDVAFHQDCVKRVAAALRASLSESSPISHYGIGESEVEQVASNRRVLFPGGKVGFPRNSATTDPEVRAADVGTIDPFLKTLSFWDGDRPVAGLSAYAVHPMSFYGKGGVTYDFVGLAREKLQTENPEVFQMYVSGCSGDVTAGKFNDGSPENRPVLANRIYEAMKKSWQATERFPLEEIGFFCVDLNLPPRSSEGFTEEAMTQRLKDPEQTTFQRNLAAMGLAWRSRVEQGQAIDVPVLDLGKAQYLLMPAESFVQYQLEAQKIRPDSFVLVAGYGECGPGYIPSFQATQEGFIDAHSWCWVDPGSDEAMIAAIKKALLKDE